MSTNLQPLVTISKKLQVNHICQRSSLAQSQRMAQQAEDKVITKMAFPKGLFMRQILIIGSSLSGIIGLFGV